MISIRSAMMRPNYFKGVVLEGPLIRASPVEATPTRLFLAKVVAKVVPLAAVSDLLIMLFFIMSYFI